MLASRALEADWAFLERALGDLQNYLLSPQLFWTLSGVLRIGGSAPLPSLTLGNLLLSLKRLEAYPWQGGLDEALNNMREQAYSVRDRWARHWREKIRKEIPVRLSVWGNYLREATEQGIRLAEYRSQVRSRVILSLLQNEGGIWEPEKTLELGVLDDLLFSLLLPGPFVWEAELENSFQKNEFPFLYVSSGKAK